MLVYCGDSRFGLGLNAAIVSILVADSAGSLVEIEDLLTLTFQTFNLRH